MPLSDSSVLCQTSCDATPPSAAERGRLGGARGDSPRPQSRGEAPCIPTRQMKLDGVLRLQKGSLMRRRMSGSQNGVDGHIRGKTHAKRQSRPTPRVYARASKGEKSVNLQRADRRSPLGSGLRASRRIRCRKARCMVSKKGTSWGKLCSSPACLERALKLSKR